MLCGTWTGSHSPALGRNSCTGELPRRVTAALAQNSLSHAKSSERDRDKVLNYPTKLGIGTAKIPSSQRKPDIGNLPAKSRGQSLHIGWQ